MRSAPLLLAYLTSALAGCQQPPGVDSKNSIAGPEAPQPGRSSFAPTKNEMLEFIASLGPPWSTLSGGMEHSDGFTSGKMLRLVPDRGSPLGSAKIGILPNAKVWNVALSSGIGVQCGAAAKVDAIMPKVIKKLAPNLILSDAQRGTLSKGLHSRNYEKVEIGLLHITTSGGCAPTIDLRYVSEDK